MSIETFEVPFHEGRVCFLTERPSGSYATVECYEKRTAFYIKYNRQQPLHVGDWVKFRGKTRINLRLKKNNDWSKPLVPYYHNPHDGGNRFHWFFFDLEESEATITAPPELTTQLKDTILRLRRTLDSWTANNDSLNLHGTIWSLTQLTMTLKHIRRQTHALERDENVKVSALDISI